MNDLRLEQVYIFLMERAVRQMKKYSHQILIENDVHISSEQWVVLKRISDDEGINQREVADLTFKDPASVTRILDLLEKSELVERQPAANDRRTYSLFLTKNGKALVAKVTPLAKEIRAAGLQGISKQEQEIFEQVLKKIYDNLS